MTKRFALLLLLASGAAFSEPSIKFDCTGSADRRQECVFSIDRERIEKAFEPIEKQTQAINTPSEAIQAMANAMTAFANLIKQEN